MKYIYMKTILLLMLLLPLSSFAASVTGVLNAYSFKDKQLTVNKKVYNIDIENLPIIYGKENVGTDVLRPGLKVKLIFGEDTVNQGDAAIIRLLVLTRVSGMES